ncbi:hypothetical protein K443DRAFT_367027 [Laccaria amethystina LaAM-08-1]|uniref:Uncharacterized protein n=1 Tax=Laccaria amethystina LaAM-08-1 TaxID=1095629 RepID=A0A0C9Y4U0_9AGAR|nr:hypothetical protein K443DRAFT_367027 [Laccaria amethystina LaAM-08-1]
MTSLCCDGLPSFFCPTSSKTCQYIESSLGIRMQRLCYSAVWVSIPFAEHLLSGYDNAIDSILLLPSLYRALEPVSITWNGIPLGLDCSIAKRVSCNLDYLATLRVFPRLDFTQSITLQSPLGPTHESNLRINVLQQPGALTFLSSPSRN